MRPFLIALLFGATVLGGCAGPPPSPTTEEDTLTRGEWRLKDLDGKGVIDDSMVSVTFNPDGKAAGHGGCNRWFGSWRRDGNALTFSQLGSTRMACTQALMHQEAVFLSALQEASGYRFADDGALVVATRDGRSLTFRIPSD